MRYCAADWKWTQIIEENNLNLISLGLLEAFNYRQQTHIKSLHFRVIFVTKRVHIFTTMDMSCDCLLLGTTKGIKLCKNSNIQRKYASGSKSVRSDDYEQIQSKMVYCFCLKLFTLEDYRGGFRPLVSNSHQRRTSFLIMEILSEGQEASGYTASPAVVPVVVPGDQEVPIGLRADDLPPSYVDLDTHDQSRKSRHL